MYASILSIIMSPHTKIDTLILSDLHLGSPIGKPWHIRTLLTRHHWKRLILLGDIFDGYTNYQHLDQEHHDLLTLIKGFALKGCEIVWIRGNHDHNRDGSLSRFIGAPVLDQYAWKQDGKQFLAIHGDQFDAFLENPGKLDFMLHKFFLQIQKLDKKGRHIVKLIDYANARLRKLSSKVARGAIKHAIEHNAEYIFCGHTHIAKKQVHENGQKKVHYYNTGCWTHTPSTFVAVDESGNILQEKFS